MKKLSPDDLKPYVKQKETEEEIIRNSYFKTILHIFFSSKKNIINCIILFIVFCFIFLGSFFYKVDPNKQNLSFVLHKPTIGKNALVIKEHELWQGITHNIEEEDVDTLEKIANVKTTNKANTYSVKINWDIVKGADKYLVYRSSKKESKNLGVPLKELPFNITGIDDRTNLEEQTYYYHIVPVDYFGDYGTKTTLRVDVIQAITLKEAQELNKNVKENEFIKINTHILGTDYLGRDLLARCIDGGKVSLFVGIITPFIYLIIGCIYGAFSGLIGGRVDQILMRFADFVISLPFLLFVILFKVAFGEDSGITSLIIAMCALLWPESARLVRGQILQLREQNYIKASKLLGAGNFFIIRKHLLPHILSLLIVSLSFAIPAAIFTEAFLSFIDLGVKAPQASWGQICTEGVKNIYTSPHELIFPASFIAIVVLCFNFIGDGLQDALNPKNMKEQG